MAFSIHQQCRLKQSSQTWTWVEDQLVRHWFVGANDDCGLLTGGDRAPVWLLKCLKVRGSKGWRLMQPRKRKRGSDLEKGMAIIKTLEHLNQHKPLTLTGMVIVKCDSPGSLSLCHSNISLPVLSGGTCAYVSIPLLSNSWIPALYLKQRLFHYSVSEF